MTRACTAARSVSLDSLSPDGVFRVATAVQEIMTALNGAVSEEDEIVAIIKVVIKLINFNGH